MSNHDSRFEHHQPDRHDEHDRHGERGQGPVRPEALPPVHTQADLHRTWRTLMGELGFSRPALWVMLLGRDGRVSASVMQIDEVPDRPEPALLDALAAVCGDAIAEGLGDRVAFLRSRPGSRHVTGDDCAWARGLVESAGRAGVPCEPVHLATDEVVRVLPLDDLGLPDTA